MRRDQRLRRRNPRERLVVRPHASGRVVVGLTEREKWSWADTMVLRGEMRRLAASGRRRISLDLSSVAILPSGFFGMLCEWLEESEGELHLLNTRPEIRRTLWFRLFAERSPSAEASDEAFQVFPEPQAARPAFLDQQVDGSEI